MSKLGINEKSLPKNITWMERLTLAKKLGFSFIELSIDETDERLERLDWSQSQRFEVVTAIYEAGITIETMMLSGLRKYPLGSADELVQKQSIDIVKKAVLLARDLGIRNIQIAGYDEFYGEKTLTTRENFIENLQQVVYFAAQFQIMIAIETMDDYFINTIAKVKEIKKQIKSPWLQAYPDLGNISAWLQNETAHDLETGIENIIAIHLKDTLKVTHTALGKFKDVPFGEGDVDFRGLLRTLKRLDYHGTYTIEMWSETLKNPIPTVEAAHEFFEGMFNELGIKLED